MKHAEKFPAFGIGMNEKALRKAAKCINNHSNDIETTVVECFGETHYTYEKIGHELKNWVEAINKEKEEKKEEVSIYTDKELLYVKMDKMKKYVKEWGINFREFKDYMNLLKVVKVSKGEENNCRYKSKSDDSWHMAFYIDKLSSIK